MRARFCVMADTAHLTSRATIDREETDDLRQVARCIMDQTPALAPLISVRLAEFDSALASPAPDAERAAEAFALDLRRLWLEAAAHEAASVLRSPTEGQAKLIARAHDGYGYERDLQPESLERRCSMFFPAPPPGWEHDHVIFSSGQAGMTAALLALGKLFHGDGAPLLITHHGAYFETRALVNALPFIAEAAFGQTADVVIEEPVCCDGQFHQIDTSKLVSSSPRAVIFDTTLLGRDDGVDRYLASVRPGCKQVVLRVVSSLKLMQGGFELANAGIVSIYRSHASDSGLADQLRRLRTLNGTGLHLVDAIALEAPWFLDANATDTYANAVFDHNARLASVVAEANRRFIPVTHPSFSAATAPYCTFQLPAAKPGQYDALDKEIATEAKKRKLNLVRGGSFGFRGHRYEVVHPETGEPPFLRIAMGRRGGWSCDGIIAMMGALAAS